jgi:transmembrane sensor
MRSDQARLKLVAAYLSGQLDIAARHDLEQWISASPENQRIFDEALKIWENSGARLRLPVDETDRLWLKLRSRMDEPERKTRVFSIFARSGTTLKIAASIILVSAVTYFFLPGADEEIAVSQSQKTVVVPDAVPADDVVISAGDRVAVVYLPDSSRIWLNVNSRLTYPKDFGKQAVRHASLEGEAFFEVRPAHDSPFTVAAKGAVVKVVGTTFNLRQQDAGVILTVSEGEVAFSGAGDKERLAVRAGEKAVWNGGDKPVRSKNDDMHFDAWRRANNPEFEKEKLNPAGYLTTKYTWRKNAINRSVIEGTLKNTATLAAYTDIVLKVTYVKHRGAKTTVKVKVDGIVRPGGLVRYQKKLLDVFRNTRSFEVEIESAAVATSVY